MSKSPGGQLSRARAAYYSLRANLTKDAEMKNFWDTLADEWLAINEEKLAEKDVPGEE